VEIWADKIHFDPRLSPDLLKIKKTAILTGDRLTTRASVFKLAMYTIERDT